MPVNNIATCLPLGSSVSDFFVFANVANCKVCPTFKIKNAVGHGVLRIVYSTFRDHLVSSYCKGSSHYTPSVSAAMSQGFVATVRILKHQFIQTGTLPFQIPEAIIQQAVAGQVLGVFESFLMLCCKKRNAKCSTKPPMV